MVVDIEAVHGVAVAARAGVDPDVLALFRCEAVEDFVVEVDESIEKFGAGPGIARVVLGGKATFCEVDAAEKGSQSIDTIGAPESFERCFVDIPYPFGTSFEGAADVLLTLPALHCQPSHAKTEAYIRHPG